MAGGMDLARLRQLVGEAAGCLVDLCTRDTLGKPCVDLGLPDPPRQAEPSSGQKPSKRERVDWSFASLADEGIAVVAGRMLAGRLPGMLERRISVSQAIEAACEVASAHPEEMDAALAEHNDDPEI